MQAEGSGARPGDGAASTEDGQTGGSCRIPYSGPVAIVAVNTPQALARAIADRPSDQIVYETSDTAVYDDGRVVTTSLANVGEHLNALGWAENPMQILGAYAAPGGVRSGGSDWRAGASDDPPPTRKARRRG